MTTVTPVQEAPAAGSVVSTICPLGHASAEDYRHSCEHCREVANLLPKLAQPGWVHWIGATLAKPAIAGPGPKLTKKEERKRARLKHRRAQRCAELRSALRPCVTA